MKKNKKLNLSFEQEEALCCLIDDWYLHWKNGIADYDTKTHRLGFAKEQLKALVCKYDDIVNCHGGGGSDVKDLKNES